MVRCCHTLSNKTSLHRVSFLRIGKPRGFLGGCWLRVWLRLRSWSHSSWIQALHQALLYWQLRIWACFTFCVSCCLSAPPSPSFPQKWTLKIKKKELGNLSQVFSILLTADLVWKTCLLIEKKDYVYQIIGSSSHFVKWFIVFPSQSHRSDFPFAAVAWFVWDCAA